MSLPRLYLIRHGNTDWSETHRFTGRTDLPLNARGEQNARLLAARLNGLSFACVFTSPLQRARRTCELAGFGSAAEIDPDLYEWDYGEFEGQNSIEVRREKPSWELFRDGAPGGESTQQIANPRGSFHQQGSQDQRRCRRLRKRPYLPRHRRTMDRPIARNRRKPFVLDRQHQHSRLRARPGRSRISSVERRRLLAVITACHDRMPTSHPKKPAPGDILR